MGKFTDFCPANHLKAVLYRRYITFKRSWRSIIISMAETLFLSALGIAVYYMMVGMDSLNDDSITFNSYTRDIKDFIIIDTNNNNPIATELIQKLKDKYTEQTGKPPGIINYDSVTHMQDSLYNLQSTKQLTHLIPFALIFLSISIRHRYLYKFIDKRRNRKSKLS